MGPHRFRRLQPAARAELEARITAKALALGAEAQSGKKVSEAEERRVAQQFMHAAVKRRFAEQTRIQLGAGIARGCV